jgi:hypothetical protein
MGSETLRANQHELDARISGELGAQDRRAMLTARSAGMSTARIGGDLGARDRRAMLTARIGGERDARRQ